MKTLCIVIATSVIVAGSLIGGWWYFGQQQKLNSVDGGDTITILSNMINQQTTAMLNIAKNTASPAEMRKFKIKMGSCMLLSLMKMPEIQGDFEYLTLQEKVEVAVNAAKTTYRNQYAKDIQECYANLEPNLKEKVLIRSK